MDTRCIYGNLFDVVPFIKCDNIAFDFAWTRYCLSSIPPLDPAQSISSPNTFDGSVALHILNTFNDYSNFKILIAFPPQMALICDDSSPAERNSSK